jgi:hypothetical protein
MLPNSPVFSVYGLTGANLYSVHGPIKTNKCTKIGSKKYKVRTIVEYPTFPG